MNFNSNDRPNLISAITKELKTFITDFSLHPLQYLYEHDIQSFLYTKLFPLFSKSVELPENEWTKKCIDNRYINPLRTEYPVDYFLADIKPNPTTAKLGGGKFDIALIENMNFSTNHYHWQVSLTIELKLRINNFKSAILLEDFKKLKDYKPKTNFLGLAILFDQTFYTEFPSFITNYKNSKNYLDKIIIEKIPLQELELRDNHIYGIHILLINKEINLILLTSNIPL